MMTDKFRKNAGIVVFNKDKKVLLCLRAKEGNRDNWQFPQGGIDEDESPVDTAKRELLEETGIQSIELVKALDTPLRYYFPKDVVNEFWLKKGTDFAGQEQYWSLFYFYGDDSEINVKDREEVEFKDYKWVKIEESLETVWKPKEEVYKAVVKAFSPIIENYK